MRNKFSGLNYSMQIKSCISASHNITIAISTEMSSVDKEYLEITDHNNYHVVWYLKDKKMDIFSVLKHPNGSYQLKSNGGTSKNIWIEPVFDLKKLKSKIDTIIVYG
jgi:hypothetical protein